VSDVTVEVTTGSVTVNLGTEGSVSGATGLTTLNRLTKVSAVGEVGMSNIAELSITGVLSFSKTGTTARTVTFPDAAITVARTDAAQTFTGQSTFTDGILTTHCDASTSAGVHIGNNAHADVAIFGAGGGTGLTLYGQLNALAIDSTSASGIVTRQAATQDAVKILGRAGGTGSYISTLTTATLSASVTLTLPAVTGTLAVTSTNTWTGVQTYQDDLFLTGAKFLYLRGDASTDGSVRISSPSSGTASVEIRVSGSWVTQQTWSGT
jgi:hypothetical protein